MAAEKKEKNKTNPEKPGKYTKAPGIFKKPVKKAKWEKSLKKIYLPEDRKFLESLAVEEAGYIHLNVITLSRSDYNRLKTLGKAIKANRKSLNFILIFILVLLIGGGLFFQLYLKNKLVQRLIETRLEKVFLAKVDTKGVNLSVFKGEFSVDNLIIADAADPMKNLIEFSRVEADIDTAELLQGRVYIEELGFSGLVRGAARTVSGALPVEESSQTSGPLFGDGKKTESNEGIISGVVGQLSALTGEIDIEGLLEQQKEKLESFRIIDDSKNRIDQYSESWKSRSIEWGRRIDEWDSSVKYIGSVNADSFKSIENAKSVIERLQKIYSDAERDYSEIRSDYTAAEQQYNDALNMMNGIKTAIAADYKYIESLVTIPAGDKVDWAASVIENQLSLPIKKYLSYLDRGLEWYDRFKRLGEIKEKRSPEKRRDGRSLPPAPDAPPGFVLVHAFASGDEPGLNYHFDLNNLVSEPDKWDAKTSLDIGLDTASTGSAVALITEDSLDLSVPAASFDLNDTLKGLDIASFSGILSIDSDVRWGSEGFSGSIDLRAGELVLAEAKESSILFNLINTAVESVKPLSAEGDFTWNDAKGLELALETDLDEGLGDAARALISEGAEEGVRMLQDFLGQQLSGPMEEFESVKAEIEVLVEQLKSYQTEIDSYRQQADDKIAEIRKSVEDNARKEAENLIKEALPADVDKKLDEAAGALKKGLGSSLKF